jgi:hypothetical protein
MRLLIVNLMALVTVFFPIAMSNDARYSPGANVDNGSAKR